MSKTEFQVLDTIHPKNIYPFINITPVLWHRGDFCGIDRIEVRWPDELRLFYDKQSFEQMKATLEEHGGVASYEDGYSDGFDKGEEAVVQQMDAIIDGHWSSDEAVKSMRRWIADFWKERES